MKYCLIGLLFLFLVYSPINGFAGALEDYEEARKIYIAAGASVAAYEGRIGELAARYLEQAGWQVDHYIQAEGRSGARFIVAKKIHPDTFPVYIVAIVGTENGKDVKIDLKVNKVYFSGSNFEEFTSNADKKDVPDTEPKVHRGFNEFVQAGPAAVLQNPHSVRLSLPDLLRADKNSKVYLVGHSLGGAAAILTGARLISMGIDPAQIEVITFGAPAVGNAAFADRFQPVLRVTRIVNSGDPIPGILQTRGYRQFGKEIEWAWQDDINGPHKLIGYVDSAIKNYYDKRRQAVENGTLVFADEKSINLPRVYIAPLQNNLPVNMEADFWYMNEALADEYRLTLAGRAIIDTSAVPDWRKAAVAAGCQRAVVSEVSAFKMKKEKDIYYITVTQTIFDVVTGSVIDTAIFSTGTYNLTPLEAFIHSFKGMNARQNSKLAS